MRTLEYTLENFSTKMIAEYNSHLHCSIFITQKRIIQASEEEDRESFWIRHQTNIIRGWNIGWDKNNIYIL